MRKWIILGLAMINLSAFAQKKIEWSVLEQVEFDYIQNFDQNFWYGKPTYGEEVKELEGQEIIIKGYVLPMDITGETYVLSAFPFSSCFFCGGAGQESVIELRLKKKKLKFQTDDVVTFKGTLLLNDQELELNYILENAEPYD